MEKASDGKAPPHPQALGRTEGRLGIPAGASHTAEDTDLVDMLDMAEGTHRTFARDEPRNWGSTPELEASVVQAVVTVVAERSGSHRWPAKFSLLFPALGSYNGNPNNIWCR